MPVLRLVVPPTLQQSNGSAQPVWIPVGTNGPAGLFIEAVNDGDGAFALDVSGGNAAWLVPAVTGTAPCSFDGGRTCTVIGVTFATSGIAPGAYDGEVTVRDPVAVDSGQRVQIHIHVGTNVPASIQVYVPPTIGASDRVEFETAGGPSPNIVTTSAGGFLSAASSPFLGIRPVHKHLVIATYRDSLTVGPNAGSFTITNSSFGPDNRMVPVTLNVTDDPIADAGVDQIEFFTSEGVATQHGGTVRTIVVNNRGNGELAVAGFDVAIASGGEWLSVENLGNNAFTVRADGAGLGAGLYSGTLSMNSNAVNGPCVIAITFLVLPAGAPDINFRGAVNSASFSTTQPLGPGTIGTVFGVYFSDTTANAEVVPLPTNLGGAKVLINGIEAPLFFAAYNQINFQVPFELAPGAVTIQVMRDAMMSSPISATVDVRSPGIFRWGIGEYGIITNFTQGNFPLPPDVGAALGLPAAPAQGGDFLVIWCTGLGSVTEPVATGAAASGSPLSFADAIPKVTFGLPIFSPSVTPSFAGMAPGFVGLFQVNLPLPTNLSPNNHFPVTLRFGDGGSSNVVEIAVQ
ncbi:MAG: hypothetical protein O2968_17120 [Acidobacteria bacterium]|nr:hypothetical protein [Acidobacteriota bacterium]